MMIFPPLQLIKYEDVLADIATLEEPRRHLLIGNGFNRALGIETGYTAILKRMAENDSIYTKLINIIPGNSDIEQIISFLGTAIQKGDCKSFLDEYISANIKRDFMLATSQIVDHKIYNSIRRNQSDLHVLFDLIRTRFTLNFDHLLYYTLLHLAKTPSAEQNILFSKSDWDALDDIGKFVMKAYNEGASRLKIGDAIGSEWPLKSDSKAEFKLHVWRGVQDAGHTWKRWQVDNSVDHFWPHRFDSSDVQQDTDNESDRNAQVPKKEVLIIPEVNDSFGWSGSPSSDPVYSKDPEQNLFLLHGAFYIYERNGKTYKLTRDTNSTLDKKLVEYVRGKSDRIVCVFGSEDKLVQINKHSILKDSFAKLSTLSGAIVIIGCALDENDSHIFSQIGKSRIEKIYISTDGTDLLRAQAAFDRAQAFFPHQTISMFARASMPFKDGR